MGGWYFGKGKSTDKRVFESKKSDCFYCNTYENQISSDKSRKQGQEFLKVNDVKTNDKITIKTQIKLRFLNNKIIAKKLEYKRGKILIKSGEEKIKTRPGLTLTLFIIGFLFAISSIIALFFVSSSVALLLVLPFELGLILGLVANLLSVFYLNKIKKNNLPDKKWVYKFVLIMSAAFILGLIIMFIALKPPK